jgi:hypothetical protein
MAAPPPIHADSLIFDAGNGKWRLFRRGDEYILHVYACAAGYYSYRVGVFASGFASGDIYVIPREDLGAPFPFPLVYPLEQLILLNLLAEGRGMLLHAGAIVDQSGHAVLFTGPSGAGKSTIACLWLERGGATLLNDDQVVVRLVDGQFVVYGTPWGGSAGEVSPRGAPLSKIFFLHQAVHNAARSKHPLLAASDLMMQSFPSFHDGKALDFTLGFLGDLVQQVPCFDLEFVPALSVLDLMDQIE